jgi:hypothetical protein
MRGDRVAPACEYSNTPGGTGGWPELHRYAERVRWLAGAIAAAIGTCVPPDVLAASIERTRRRAVEQLRLLAFVAESLARRLEQC